MAVNGATSYGGSGAEGIRGNGKKKLINPIDTKKKSVTYSTDTPDLLLDLNATSSETVSKTGAIQAVKVRNDGYVSALALFAFNKYEADGFHDLHNDINSGYPNRKYVCTIQISDTSDYTGGDLQIHKYINDACSTEDYMTAPRDKGCAIVYDNKAVHQVTEITNGTRYSLNDCAG